MTQDFPKEYIPNLAWRRKLILDSHQDAEFLLKVKTLFFSDPLFAFNGFFYTLDVRRRPFHDRPFTTYPFQDETILSLVAAINDGNDLVIEKSRDMGVSWMVILVYLWFWLSPEGGADFLLGSRIEDYVDKKGDMRTLLEKARYGLYRLPKFLRPKGFKKSRHDNFKRLNNPETGASITGESNNPNFSTGGRYLSTLFDEFAKWENTDESAWMDAGDASPCRVAVSTPFGAGGRYYSLVTDPGKKKLTLHWSLHPRKAEGLCCIWPKPEEAEDTVDPDHWVGLSSPWYESECLRRDEDEIAQNLDINYIGAGNPVFDKKSGKRLGQLLRSPKEPTGFFILDPFSYQLFPVGSPRDTDNHILEWEEPKPHYSYTLGIDVAEGKQDGDYSIVKVLCRETESIVGTFASRIDEVQLARIVVAMGRRWTPNWTAIETNGPGLATFDLCAVDMLVPYLFMMPRFDQARGGVSFTKGWKTTTSSRNKLISGIKEWLLNGEGWADSRFVAECTTFVRNKTGKPEAKSGCHDDEVIAFGIALQTHYLAPYQVFKEKDSLREDGLSTNLFVPQPSEGGDLRGSLEERCLQTLLRKRKEIPKELEYPIGTSIGSNIDRLLGSGEREEWFGTE